jgi:high-affinity nickel permease
MHPKLVEPYTKYSLDAYLRGLKKSADHKHNFLFNLGILSILVFIVTFTLYLKYRERNDVDAKIKKENEKRDFLINYLQLYQSMKSSYIV